MKTQDIKRAISDELPNILTLVGISGFVTATFMAVKATPKANLVMENADPFIPDSGYERYLESTKLLLPIYGPSIGMMLIASAFIIGGQHVSKRRLFAVNSLYIASQRYLSNLQSKIVETVGRKKHDEIVNDAAAPERVPDIQTVEGSVLCYDGFSDRYFTVDSIETIRRIINNLNQTLYSDMFVTVNDFYSEVDLSPVTYADDIGWDIEGGFIDIRLGTAMTEDGRPCVTIQFTANPKHIYQRLIK